MKIDIAICTYNRASLLRQTLASIAAAELSDGLELRVIVVNNNCSDETDDVARSAAGHLNIHLAHQPLQGHTHARSKAIEVADSDLLLWTDDDVLVDRKWIATYAQAANDTSLDFWGGHIHPVFQPAAPAWIIENMDALSGCFAARDLGETTVSFSHERLPYGANFAIRTEVQKQFMFNAGLGREKA